MQTQVRATGEGEQYTLSAFHRGFQQRGVNGLFSGNESAIFAPCFANAHQSGTGIEHDGAHVGKVHVDHAGNGDDVRNALHTVEQHFIGRAERFHHGEVFVPDLEQAIVRDHDQRVAHLGQRLNTLFRLLGTASALEFEGFGHHTHRQGAHFLGYAGHYRCRAGAGAAALTSGDEHHVRTFEGFFDFGLMVLSGCATDFWVSSGP